MQAFPIHPLNVITMLAADPVRWEYEEYRRGLRPGQAPPGQDMALLDAYTRQLRLTSPLEIYSRPFTAQRLLERNARLHTLGTLGFAARGLQHLPGSLTSVFAQPYLRTARDHQQAQALALASLFDPHNLTTVVGTAASADLTPVPPATLRPVVERHLAQGMASKLGRAALKQLKKELGDLPTGPRANPRPKANEIIAKVKASFGAESFAMPAPTSSVALQEALKSGDSRGVEALKQAFFRSEANNMLFMMRGLTPPVPTNDSFVRWLFSQPAGAYKATTPAPNFGGGPVEDFALGASSDMVYFWFTEDQAAREPSFAEARKAVEASWRLEKARQLAREKAEAIEARINSKNLTPADAERVLREHGEPFELDNVAQMVRSREVHAQATANYKPFEVPEELRSRLPYPPLGLARQLQVLKRPGEATVVADMPGNTDYVAVLLDRSEPTVEQFGAVYANSPRSDPLFDRLLEEKSLELRQAMLAQLRREAGEVDNSGRFKVPADIRSRDLGRPEE